MPLIKKSLRMGVVQCARWENQPRTRICTRSPHPQTTLAWYQRPQPSGMQHAPCTATPSTCPTIPNITGIYLRQPGGTGQSTAKWHGNAFECNIHTTKPSYYTMYQVGWLDRCKHAKLAWVTATTFWAGSNCNRKWTNSGRISFPV